MPEGMTVKKNDELLESFSQMALSLDTGRKLCELIGALASAGNLPPRDEARDLLDHMRQTMAQVIAFGEALAATERELHRAIEPNLPGGNLN